MVNSKNVAFKVDKQIPSRGPPPQPYATVINCRKPRGRRALRGVEEVRSQQVPVPAALLKVSGGLYNERKRKRGPHDPAHDESVDAQNQMDGLRQNSSANGANMALVPYQPLFPSQRPRLSKPTRFRRGKTLSKAIDLDCWFTILSFSDPAQLLEMRGKIASCFRFLRDNPALWKHSRTYYYGNSLPEPPAELTEFQYAHLRHGHGCMSCETPSTRKTYWAFLRRWCKACLQSKTIKEHEAIALLRGANGEDITFIQRCLPAGVVDSWGNFVGAGPAQTHSLKTVYLASDVRNLVAEYIQESRDNRVSWHAEMRTWINNKQSIIDERREFARRMEAWEDSSRASKSFVYLEKKDARKAYFIEKASKLSPPISLREIEFCPAFRRAIAIPKEPNMTSWLQLKPKLEKEAASLRRIADPPSASSGSGEAPSRNRCAILAISALTNPATPTPEPELN